MNDSTPAPDRSTPNGLGGWLLVYLPGSIVMLTFCAAGLSGWFFDYPLPLFISLAVILTAPLWLLLFKLTSAPRWNLLALWTGAGLLCLRILSGLTRGDMPLDVRTSTMLTMFVVSTVGWAGLWTVYFQRSQRVSNTFG